MHILSCDISSLIKDFHVDMLREDHRTTSALKTWKCVARSYKSVPEALLLACNQFLRDLERHFIGDRLHVDFAKGERSDIPNRFFNKTGDIGMLESYDYGKIDLVLPFIDAIWPVEQNIGGVDGFTACSLRSAAINIIQLCKMTGLVFSGVEDTAKSDQRDSESQCACLCKVRIFRSSYL